GLLTMRGAPDWHPAPKALRDACAEAAKYCDSIGYPIEKLAMQYSLGNKRITSTLFSTTNPQNVLKNIDFISTPADEEVVKKVREIIGEQFRVSWKNS
ncbi:MAG: aldo/keto reductase, partial [Bacteroidales bacterium]|nr:aldo/keto reductase [Bacteroidales bacterium]